MEEKIYKISLANGTELTNLKLNGNNFITAQPITEETFEDGLAHVVINDGEKDEIHENMGLVQIMKDGDEYWFILRDVPATEIEMAKLRSDMEYLAMMSDVEL